MSFLVITFIALLLIPIIDSFAVSMSSNSQNRRNHVVSRSSYLKRMHHPIAIFVRRRRIPDSVKYHTCGHKFLEFVKRTCGGPCSISAEVNLATKCCHQQCNDQDIRKYCCPLK
uniref:IlGF domain-containing protein n=1 Tax=Caenorhabditis tropicalis TaxID=1561998 RepID=A0A1I7UA68_9PELO